MNDIGAGRTIGLFSLVTLVVGGFFHTNPGAWNFHNDVDYNGVKVALPFESIDPSPAPINLHHAVQPTATVFFFNHPSKVLRSKFPETYTFLPNVTVIEDRTCPSLSERESRFSETFDKFLSYDRLSPLIMGLGILGGMWAGWFCVFDVSYGQRQSCRTPSAFRRIFLIAKLVIRACFNFMVEDMLSEDSTYSQISLYLQIGIVLFHSVHRIRSVADSFRDILDANDSAYMGTVRMIRRSNAGFRSDVSHFIEQARENREILAWLEMKVSNWVQTVESLKEEITQLEREISDRDVELFDDDSGAIATKVKELRDKREFARTKRQEAIGEIKWAKNSISQWRLHCREMQRVSDETTSQAVAESRTLADQLAQIRKDNYQRWEFVEKFSPVLKVSKAGTDTARQTYDATPQILVLQTLDDMTPAVEQESPTEFVITDNDSIMSLSPSISRESLADGGSD